MVSSTKSAAPQRHLRMLPGGKQSDPPPGPTEDELIAAVERGDNATAGQLYDQLIDTVDGTLCRIVGRREDDHDDLVQSTFEQIVLSIMRRRFARRCSLRSWAARIATNVGLNALRSRQRRRKVLAPQPEPSQPQAALRLATTTTERQLLARSELDRLRVHLAEMDERKATAVLLHDGLGHDLGEVAALTGSSVSATQSRLVRGRRELQRRLSADLAGSQRGDTR